MSESESMAESESTQIQRNQIPGRRLKQRSKVWDHFTRDTGVDGKETAKCKRCRKVYAYHGTKNLWEHYNEACGSQESADAGTSEQPPQPLPSLAQDEVLQQQLPLLSPISLPLPACAPSCYGGSSDGESSGLQEEASKHLARMIALRGYDASVLDDDCFRSFVRSINPEFEVPSRVSIENMCDGIFDEARRDLLDRMRRSPGKVSLAVGRAKTMEKQVLYVACHFIDDGWNLHKAVLHATVTTDHHEYIGHYVRKTISDHGIDDRVFMVAYETTDEVIDHALKGRQSGSLLRTNPNRNEIFCTTYMDSVLHSCARRLIPGNDFTLQVFSAMKDLLLNRQELLELHTELDLHNEWAYDEHWYACYCSLKVLCKKGCHWQPTDAELDTTKLLCKLWENIYRAIRKFSFSTHPTANLCLEELWNLRDTLIFELEFSSGDILIELHEARNTLLGIDTEYLAWTRPHALDPRYKLKFISSYFERFYGSEGAKEYISKVTKMITELYAKYAKEYGTTDGEDHVDGASNAMGIATSADDPLEQEWNEHCHSQQGMMTQVTRSSYPEAETELDRYLRDPLASPRPGFDILNWWKDHSSVYPVVARMARDTLAMPTCSKLSSDQMYQVRSIIRGYSKKPGRTLSPKRQAEEEE